MLGTLSERETFSTRELCGEGGNSLKNVNPCRGSGLFERSSCVRADLSLTTFGAVCINVESVGIIISSCRPTKG